MLEDIVIHQIDIRRPLERPRHIPDRRMIPVARDLWTNRFFPGAKLFEGINAIATDADWSAGDGLGVTGPIEALVLTLAGRSPRSTSCKVMEQRSCLCAQRLSGSREDY